MAVDEQQAIRAGLGAWSEGDLEGALENIAPEIEFQSSGLFPGVESVYRGHEGFRQFWRDFREAWARISFEIEHLVEGKPHRYAVVGRFEAMGRDGIAVGRHIGMVHETAASGSVTRIESYGTWDEAFDAAGVPRAARPTS
jgi:ketosteroid isomerase-like protein